jgi:hypothetical protein
LAILDDEAPGCIVVEFLSSDGSVAHVERLEPKAGAGKMRVQGGGA